MKLYGKSTCTSCRDAKSYLSGLGVEFEWRDYGKKPLSEAELKQLIGRRPAADFMNPRSTPYRNLGLGEKRLSRAEVLDLLLEEANLLKRPVLVVDDRCVLGFDRNAYRELACSQDKRR